MLFGRRKETQIFPYRNSNLYITTFDYVLKTTTFFQVQTRDRIRLDIIFFVFEPETVVESPESNSQSYAKGFFRGKNRQYQLVIKCIQINNKQCIYLFLSTIKKNGRRLVLATRFLYNIKIVKLISFFVAIPCKKRLKTTIL